jgi:hypothetical protein
MLTTVKIERDSATQNAQRLHGEHREICDGSSNPLCALCSLLYAPIFIRMGVRRSWCLCSIQLSATTSNPSRLSNLIRLRPISM